MKSAFVFYRGFLSAKVRLRAVSLFLENRGEERKTFERASVTVSVMRTATSFAFLPKDFRGKESLLAVYAKVGLLEVYPLNYRRLVRTQVPKMRTFEQARTLVTFSEF